MIECRRIPDETHDCRLICGHVVHRECIDFYISEFDETENPMIKCPLIDCNIRFSNRLDDLQKRLRETYPEHERELKQMLDSATRMILAQFQKKRGLEEITQIDELQRTLEAKKRMLSKICGDSDDEDSPALLLPSPTSTVRSSSLPVPAVLPTLPRGKRPKKSTLCTIIRPISPIPLTDEYVLRDMVRDYSHDFLVSHSVL